MASNNPALTARRVLSALDANASIGKSTSNISTKPGQVVEKTALSISGSTQSPTLKRSHSPGGSGAVGGKRSRADSPGLEDGEASERAYKRRGIQPAELADLEVDRSSQATEDDEMVAQSCEGEPESEGSSEQGVQTEEPNPASEVSPSTSLNQNVTGLEEDSQNTVATSFTLPVEVPEMSSTGPQTQISQPISVAPSPRTLRKEETRKVRPSVIDFKPCLIKKQHAAAIKLRLGLASYKIRTNQLDVPLSRLQVRTMSSRFPPLPRLPPASDVPRRPVSEPSTSFIAARVPDIQVQKPTLQNTSIIPTLAYSPEKMAHGASPTAILPRQRESLINPPQLQRLSRTQSPEENSPTADPISSVVSEGAVDGLLSLMGARR